MKRKIVGITVVIMTLFLAFLVVEADKRGYITGGETEAMSERNYLVISTLPAAEKTAVKVGINFFLSMILTSVRIFINFNIFLLKME